MEVVKMKKGFTLTELLVVIVIIGILISLVVPSVTKARNKAKEAQVKAGIHDIEVALSSFSAGNSGWYPGVGYDPSGTQSLQSSMLGIAGRSGISIPDGGEIISSGVVGGRMDCMVDPRKCGSETPSENKYLDDYWRWDRLYLEGVLDEYPTNPFSSAKAGNSSVKRGMHNIFVVSVLPVSGTGGPDFIGTCLSKPAGEAEAFAGGGNWYSYENYNTVNGRLSYGWDDASTSTPAVCNAVTGDDNNSWEETPTLYPRGDFAYIPLDSVDKRMFTDSSGNLANGEYMAFVENYWIIGYGAESAWKSDIFNVDSLASGNNCGLKFQQPLGRIDPASTASFLNCTPTEYENRVLEALRGAILLQGTAYTEQAFSE